MLRRRTEGLLQIVLFLLLWGCAGMANAIDAKAIFSASQESVVLIMSFDQNNQPLSIGSGFFVGNGKAIATNYHVIEGSSSVKVKRTSGTVQQINNDIGVYLVHDLILLEVPAKGTALSLTKRTPMIGEDIVSIGKPKGLEGPLSTGIIRT